ncbi:hypothetical protein LE190_06695 [Massilia oculi]|uniref:Uncharacterized protein n=1 Tax=Massilia hydrophila TaxID=3044279 RepID=A0ABS7Y7G4_9BURK|nr:hypothetical protein [Massilia oculi]MCA1855614.1 hypothetical protein [Massilia oculi]
MKLRPTVSHLAGQFHRPLRFGRRWRGHELALRMVQLVLLVLLAGVGAKLIAEGVALAVNTIASMMA